LESSNVDLTTELVNMITAQRSFDANAQVVTTSNQESQTVIQISH
jgi:flagellar hook protein FlgE